ARQRLVDPLAAPVVRLENPYCLPRFRFVPRAVFHPSYEAALAAARAANYDVGRTEHCVRPGDPEATLSFPGTPQLLGLADRGGRVRARYRSPGAPACFVMAGTYDRGWRAAADGQPLRVFPTAAGQMAVQVPAGEHELTLEYRDPRIGAG